MAVLYLALSFLAGFVLVQRLTPGVAVLARLAGTFAVGLVLTAWVAFAAAWTAHAAGAGDATYKGVWVASAVNAGIVWLLRGELRRDAIRMSRADAALGAAALALSGWIMHARLSGDPLTVSLNAWGDLALHVGIARSFSQGENFPPELPIFAGETIRYHFGFDFYAGSLERAGLPIEWAFNLPGGIAFAAILLLVVEYARHLWRSTAIGVIAAGLFATNSSLAFLRYLDKHGSLSDALAPSTIWNHVGYDGAGPYNGDKIAIFNTLNPYLTQTHLIVALVVVLFVGLVVLESLYGGASKRMPLDRARAVALGVLLGASFWLNGIVVLVALTFTAVLFYVFGGRARATARPALLVAAIAVGVFAIGAAQDSDALRYPAFFAVLGVIALGAPLGRSLPFLVPAGLVALPQLVWLNGGFGTGGSVSFHTGYLVEDFDAADPTSWWDFGEYWWLNLGLMLPLLVVAAVWSRRGDRKLLAAVMAVFVVGNLVAFGRELGGHNHKVFNYWEILANLFAAYALVRLVAWLWAARPTSLPVLRRSVAAVAAAVAGVLLLASGLLDYMTLRNDPRYEVFGDRVAALDWIRESTDPDAVFLTAYGDVYTTPTLAGRRVYLGGFAPWTAIMGYDNVPREQRIAAFYAAADRAEACRALAGTGVDYIEYGQPEMQTDAFEVNPELFPGGFRPAYSDGSYTYFDARASCGDALAASDDVAASHEQGRVPAEQNS